VARLSLWRQAIASFSQSPVWGHGFRATRWLHGPSSYFTADSYYLEALADSGLIGLFLLFSFLGTLFISAGRLHRLARVQRDAVLQKFAAGYLAAFVGLLIINLFGGMFVMQKIWGTFLMLSALACNQLWLLRRKRGID
jgi:O-antigen ligase